MCVRVLEYGLRVPVYYFSKSPEWRRSHDYSQVLLREAYSLLRAYFGSGRNSESSDPRSRVHFPRAREVCEYSTLEWVR